MVQPMAFMLVSRESLQEILSFYKSQMCKYVTHSSKMMQDTLPSKHQTFVP